MNRLPEHRDPAVADLKKHARKILELDRLRLLREHPFVGHLAMHLELVPTIDDRLKTAATDGRRLFVDIGFYVGLDDDERIGLLGHEVWHCALRHFQRKGHRDQLKFNYACDVEVDLLLRRDGFKVEILPHDPSWEGKSAEQIYDLMFPGLEQFQKADRHIFHSEHQRGGDAAPDVGADGSCDGSKTEAAGNGNLASGTRDAGHDPEFSPRWDPELSEDWKVYLNNAVEREKLYGGKNIGALPGNVSALVQADREIAATAWKNILLDYASRIFGGERQWLPPMRRYVWEKLYLPGRTKNHSIEIVLAIDTSGSTIEDLPEFVTELRGMAAAFGEYKLTVIQCDIAIHDVREYSNDDPPPEWGITFRGFGGTSFREPFRYVEERMPEPPDVFIYLTDGHGTAPERAPAYPVIWCLTHNGVMPAEWGLKVKIPKVTEV